MIDTPRHGNTLLWRRYASRIRRLSRFRSTARPSRFPAAMPTRLGRVSSFGPCRQNAVISRPRTRRPSSRIRVNSSLLRTRSAFGKDSSVTGRLRRDDGEVRDCPPPSAARNYSGGKPLPAALPSRRENLPARLRLHPESESVRALATDATGLESETHQDPPASPKGRSCRYGPRSFALSGADRRLPTGRGFLPESGRDSPRPGRACQADPRCLARAAGPAPWWRAGDSFRSQRDGSGSVPRGHGPIHSKIGAFVSLLSPKCACINVPQGRSLALGSSCRKSAILADPFNLRS